MNDLQKAYLGMDVGIFHASITCDKIYNTDDIYSDFDEWGKLIKNSKTIFDRFKSNRDLEINQFEFNNTETLIILAATLEYAVVNYETRIEKVDAKLTYSSNTRMGFVIHEIDFKENITSIEMHFKDKIIDHIVKKVIMLPAVNKEAIYNAPEITTKYSVGQSLVNVKFKMNDQLKSVINHIKVELYDSENDLLGVYKPEPDMHFVAITNLAFGNYTYKVVAYKGDSIIVESKPTKFKISDPSRYVSDVVIVQ